MAETAQQPGFDQAAVPVVAQPQVATGPGVSLYIGDLHPDVTEAVLFEKFNPIGPVQSIRVCRDAITRRSLGYAYVNFTNTQDAEKAMEELNYEEIKGVPCRIMWSQRDPSVRRSGAGNIFIKNLNKTIDTKALYDTFDQFGRILSCKVATDPEGKSLGFAFVHFETEEAAKQAIEQVNGKQLLDQEVFVGHFKSRRERIAESGAEKQFTNVYVKNIPLDKTEEDLENMFKKFGEVISRKLMAGEDGKSKGFGFVCFKNPEDAKKAVDAMNDTEIEGKKLFCGRAQKKTERLDQLRRQFEQRKLEMQSKFKGVNLYVKNLDESIDDDKLRQAFSNHGEITSAKVMRDEKGVSRGFGFVCFSSPEEATKAVTDMNGFMLMNKPLYVALAQRKEERAQELARQRHSRNMQMRMQMPMYPGQQPGMMYMPQMGYRPAYPMAGGRGRAPQQGMMGQNYGGFRPQPGMGAPPQGRGVGRGQTKGRQNQPQFRQQTRNIPQQQQQMPVQPVQQAPQQQAALHQPGQQPLTASALVKLTEQEQKQTLGERLYPLIAETHRELAGKITGMLLEMDNTELLHLLEDPSALSAKVQEAVQVLQEHAAKTGNQLPGVPMPSK